MSGRGLRAARARSPARRPHVRRHGPADCRPRARRQLSRSLPASAPPPSPPPRRRAATPGASPDCALATTLDATLAQPAFARAQAALVVRSLATGETLYRRNGATWLVPASTMKVLTAVAAAERLGWGYRFETRLMAMGPVVERHAARRPADRRQRRSVDQSAARHAGQRLRRLGPGAEGAGHRAHRWPTGRRRQRHRAARLGHRLGLGRPGRKATAPPMPPCSTTRAKSRSRSARARHPARRRSPTCPRRTTACW